jgi:hypothetical protein
MRSLPCGVGRFLLQPELKYSVLDEELLSSQSITPEIFLTKMIETQIITNIFLRHTKNIRDSEELVFLDFS